jgi:nucleoid-associated protein YgaU
MFNSSGEPIRAVASVKFKGTISEDKEAAKAKRSSPDLTHILRVKAGDTLPLMCKKVYGDPKYYLQIAGANNLGNFRRLEPGMEIVFPPIEK